VRVSKVSLGDGKKIIPSHYEAARCPLIIRKLFCGVDEDAKKKLTSKQQVMELMEPSKMSKICVASENNDGEQTGASLEHRRALSIIN
jgi:hypothetical protein